MVLPVGYKMPFSLKRETFCRLIAIDKLSVPDAYARAGYRHAHHNSNPYRMANLPEVANRIEELREEQRNAIVEAASVTVGLMTTKLLKVADNIYPLTTQRNATAAAAASAYRGLLMDAAKLNGLVVERTHALIERRDVQQFSDDELMAILRDKVGEPMTIDHEPPKALNGNGHDTDAPI